MKVREVLEVYHAHPPVGRFPFFRLVGVHGSDAFHDHGERHAKRIPRLNARTRSRRIALIAMSASFLCGCAGAPIKALSATWSGP